jgi:hypothetical protein
VPDLVDAVQREIHERMKNLQPAVDEHRILEQALEALEAHDLQPSTRPAVASQRRSERRSTSKRPRAST